MDPTTTCNYIVVPHVSSYIKFRLVYKLNPSLIKLYFRSYFYIRKICQNSLGLPWDTAEVLLDLGFFACVGEHVLPYREMCITRYNIKLG